LGWEILFSWEILYFFGRVEGDVRKTRKGWKGGRGCWDENYDGMEWWEAGIVYSREGEGWINLLRG